MRLRHLDRILNMLLRGTTLAVRLVFLLMMAKLLDPTAVGQYGLFLATVSYVVMVAGLDFYTFVTREILRAPAEKRGWMLKMQAALVVSLYLVLVPLVVGILIVLDWPSLMLWWFVPILLLEHLNQEISRVLVALSEQILASLLLFLRQGSWGIGLVAVMGYFPESRTLGVLLFAWAAAGALAAALGCRKLAQLGLGGWQLQIDWAWIRRGISVSFAFLIATMALRATQTIDRYWFEALTDVETLAAYVLYFGLAGALLACLDAGVMSFAYPTLISLHNAEEHTQAKALVRRILWQTLTIVATFAAVSGLVVPILIDWINRPIYTDQLYLYPWLLLAMALNGIGLVPHYGLYAKGIDRPIAHAHIAGLIVFAISAFGLSGVLGGLAIPLGLFCSFLVILVWKTIVYLQIVRAPFV